MIKNLMLPSDKIRAHSDDAIAHIIFNNPERHNAVSLEMWDSVKIALSEFKLKDEIRVLIFSGSGGKSFVSGADISKFEKERGTKETTANYNATLKIVYQIIENYPKPTISMINGHCIGGGLNLAACTDIRIASSKSKFAMPAAKLALGYPFDAVRRLINAVGLAQAKHLMFTGNPISADRALNIGLLQEVIPEDSLSMHVTNLAQTIASNAPMTIASMKFIASQVVCSDPNLQDLEACDTMVNNCFASYDYKEGRKAFMEKRKPIFKGQ